MRTLSFCFSVRVQNVRSAATIVLTIIQIPSAHVIVRSVLDTCSDCAPPSPSRILTGFLWGRLGGVMGYPGSRSGRAPWAVEGFPGSRFGPVGAPELGKYVWLHSALHCKLTPRLCFFHYVAGPARRSTRALTTARICYRGAVVQCHYSYYWCEPPSTLSFFVC